MSCVIAGRAVGAKETPYLVAELSGNHQQSLERALALVDAAADAGADAVKLQTYTADTLTLPARTAAFRLEGGLWDGRYLHDLYREAMTPWEWHGRLAERARERGLHCFSTPFDESAVDFLERTLNPPVYKVSSFEVNHGPLLRRVAATGKPVILSTGMAEGWEIERALGALKGASGVVLLKCVSAYPADPKGFNLRSLVTLREAFGREVGLSDHALTDEVALGAVALGACVIEKHLCLSRAEGGVDSGFSLEPAEFARMAVAVRRLHAALGEGRLGTTAQDEGQRRFRRSIFVSAEVREGEVLTAANLKVVRPADGLDPFRWEEVLGKRAARGLSAGEPLREGDWR